MSEEFTDEELVALETELAALKGEGASYGAPDEPQKDNIYKFFRDILRSKDSTKVGNLTDTELGTTTLGVRHYLDIAAYAKAEGLDKVSQYLVDKAEIINSTSMSKKGFLAQLFVTQIKKEQKMLRPEIKKKPWFGGSKNSGVE